MKDIILIALYTTSLFFLFKSIRHIYIHKMAGKWANMVRLYVEYKTGEPIFKLIKTKEAYILRYLNAFDLNTCHSRWWAWSLDSLVLNKEIYKEVVNFHNKSK